jgi:hypothetical protein
MAVMLKCGAIFLHIPKTGGSWVTDVLTDQGIVKKQFGHIHADFVRAIYYTQGRRMVTRGLYEWAKSGLPRGIKAIGPAQKIKHVATSVRQQQPFCFCFVRSPFDWYESWWRYMCQRSGTDWRNEPDFQSWHPCQALLGTSDADFNQFVRNAVGVRPGFVTELFSTYAQPTMNFVGRHERLAEDLVHVLRLLNVDFDEDRLRSFLPVNTSSMRDPLEWTPELRSQVERTEYAALLRFGYLSRSRAVAPSL